MRLRALLIVGPLLVWLAAAAVLWPSLAPLLNPWYLAAAAFYLAATLLLFKAPGNPVGVMMMGFPGLTALSVLGYALAVRMGFSGESAAWADALGSGFATAAMMCLPLMLLHFPDGRLPSTRWLWCRHLIVGGGVIGFAASLVNGGWGGEPEAGSLDSPIRDATAPLGDILSGLFFVLMLASFVIAGASLVRRYQRSDGVERSQIKWVALAAGVAAAALAVMLLVNSADEAWGEVTMAVSVVAVPAAIAIAVLRYRLYDIDRLVSRTVGYAIVLAVLSAVYAVSAVWLPTRLLGRQTPVFVAGSTLAVAAAFRPLRRRALRWVDRRFYRARYDAEQVEEAFTTRVRDQVDMTGLTEDWMAVVVSNLRPTMIGVWVNDGLSGK